MTRKKVGSGPQTRKKKIWITILSILLVAIIATMIILIVSKTQTSKSDTDTRSFEEIFWDSETAEEAIATFQTKINAAKTEEEKAIMYLERAQTLYEFFKNTNIKSEQIISDAKKADEILQSTASAYYVYNYARIFNKEEDINIYYNIYSEREKIENEANNEMYL